VKESTRNLVLGISAVLLFGFGGVVRADTFVIVNTNDSGPGSLRQAILDANANFGPDLIQFAIGSGTQTIQPLSPLPALTDSFTTLDGTTQPGYRGRPLIELDGSRAGSSWGLNLGAGFHTLRGLVINRFDGTGILALVSDGNTIEGNYIGTDVSGTAAAPNIGAGIFVGDSALNHIGGPASPTGVFPGNVISGNAGVGISVLAFFYGSRFASNSVRGNLIGTDAYGRVGLGNGGPGVSILGTTGNFIGGAGPGEGNLLAANAIGVAIGGSGPNITTLNFVVGNSIGTNQAGVNLGNVGQGILIEGTSGSRAVANAIGGPAGAGNAIAFNGSDGVRIAGPGDTGNPLRANRIFSNAGLGINLGSDGVTPNDLSDADTGPNLLQNFPLLSGAVVGTDGTVVRGTLQSAASSTFRIEFFSSASCDPSGFGEGATPLGSAPVTTGADGNASFSVFVAAVPIGQVITATATDSHDNTSEFSSCVIAEPKAPAEIPVLSPWGILILALALAALGFQVAR